MNEQTKMKIGIDAKWLFKGQISGKILIQNILPELFGSYPAVEWHLFLDKKDKHLALPFTQGTVKVHYVWAKFNMLSNLYVLPGYAKQLGLDAVLFQTFSPRGKSFKSIVFVHDVLFKSYPRYFTWKERLYFKPLKWTIPLADKIIITTEFVRQELEKFHYSKPMQSVDIVPLGVNSIFKPRDHHDEIFLHRVREKYNLPDLYILFVGRLNSRKNIQALIRSLGLATQNGISLVIAGDRSWKKPAIDHLLSNQDTAQRIFFTGPVSDEDLAAVYAMATVFCYPSFAEGFGLPPIEAMASGIPVVVSNTTAMPEVCGTAALFVNPDDPKDIAEKISELLHNNNLYQQKVNEGLEWSRQYTWHRAAQEIMRAILSAVEKEVK